MRLAASDISKTFGGIPVLEHVSFDVAAGERAALVGPSGSGKTTLLRLIAGFDRVDAGEIRLGDRIVETTAMSIPTHRRGVGYVAQDGALFPHLTVAANIGFGLRNASTRAERVDEVMRLVDLESALAGRYPHQLSRRGAAESALGRATAARRGSPGPRPGPRRHPPRRTLQRPRRRAARTDPRRGHRRPRAGGCHDRARHPRSG